MTPIRVLVVDDSVVVRRVMARALEADPDFEHVGSAADGRAALAKLDKLRPDVVLLDLEMPVMDGFETLRQLKATALPVVVFSYLSEAGAAATLEALALGAAAFVLKPSGAKGLGLVDDYVTSEVLPLLRAVAGPRPAATKAAARSPRPQPASRVAAVVIAVSTGGPNALAQVMADLPATFPVPILVVQHMPAVFTAQLAERLDRVCPLPVTEAADGDRVRPGRVYLAPGGRHMAVVKAGGSVRIALNDDPPENSCRPAGDVLFRSAASVYGDSLLALVMTGMGKDGLRGSQAVLAAGGVVLAQDLVSSVVDGMPRSVMSLAAAVIPLTELADELTRWVKG